MRLLMAMEKRETIHRGSYVHLDLFEALHQDDILLDPRGRFSVDLR